MPCSLRCKYIPPLLTEWPPTPNEMILWKSIVTRVCPPARLVDPTPGELSLYKLLELVCSGADPDDITGFPCGSRATSPFGFTEEVGRQVAKQKGLEGYGPGSVVTFSAFGPKQSDGFSLSSKNVDSMCEESKEPPGVTAGSIKLLPLALLCESTIDSGDFVSANCADMDCSAGSPHLNFRAVGGITPYTFSITGKGALAPSGANVTVSPPANSGGFGFTRAYYQFAFRLVCAVGLPPADCFGNTALCTAPGCCGTLGIDIIGRNCVDTALSETSCATILATCEAACNASDFPTHTGGNSAEDECVADFRPNSVAIGGGTTADWLVAGQSRGEICDGRTQAMIDAGCLPCSPTMDGLVLTVTDAIGTQVSVGISVG